MNQKKLKVEDVEVGMWLIIGDKAFVVEDTTSTGYSIYLHLSQRSNAGVVPFNTTANVFSPSGTIFTVIQGDYVGDF